MDTTWFVTGASRGMGRALVATLLAAGHRVVATARRPSDLDALVAEHGDRLRVHALDVTDPTRVRAVVDAAFAEHERVDVVVSNAGYGVFGVAEDLADADVEDMIATNLTGSIRLARAALPHLRAQGGGHLVQMSSMGGLLAFPAFSMYHATKWGIEGFYESLAQEVAPLGITTTLVEPGVVRTGFFDAAPRIPASEPYRGGPGDRGPMRVEDMTDGEDETVRAIIAAVEGGAPPRRLVLGSDAWRLVTDALRARLAEIEPQRASAALANLPTS